MDSPDGFPWWILKSEIKSNQIGPEFLGSIFTEIRKPKSVSNGSPKNEWMSIFRGESKVSNFIRSELYEIKTYMRPSCIWICMKLIPYGNAATLGQNCQFSRLQQTNLLAYMFCLGIKNHHFSATSWCMSNRVSFQNQATDTCCQESRHESLILIGSQNLYFDAFGSLYLSFPKKLRYTIVIYGKIQSYRNCKIQGWSCTAHLDVRAHSGEFLASRRPWILEHLLSRLW